MAELAPPIAPTRAEALETLGRRAMQALYCLFVLSIPLETVFYFQNQNEPDSSVSLSRMLGAALIGLAFVQWRVCFERFPASFWMIVCYLAAHAFSQLWIPDAALPKFMEHQTTLAQMAILFLISVNLLADEDFRMRLFRLFGWWLGLVALGMVMGLFGAGFDSENRASIITQDPNVTASLLTAGALCVAGDRKLLDAKRRLSRVLISLSAVIVMITAILKTGSRGGLLALGAGFIGLGVCGGKGTWKTRILIVAVVIGLLGGLVEFEFQRGTTTAARLERSWSGGDLAGRTEIYAAAWSMFLERPLLGYGGANNRFVLGARLNYPDRDTHNAFLSVLTEVGAVGGFFFFAVLLYGLLKSWRAGRRTGDAIPFALMCAQLVINISITGSREKIFWIVLAAAAASV